MADDELDLDDGWPVPEPDAEEEPAPAAEEPQEGFRGESAFLLNLISPASRMDLYPLANLGPDALLSAFLAGGTTPPRIATLWLSEDQAKRVHELVEAIFLHNITEASTDAVHQLTEAPPHLLLVNAENGRDPSSLLEMAYDEAESGAPDVIAVVSRNNSPLLRTPPEWAKSVLSLSLPDAALKLSLDRLLDLAQTRKDLEIIFLAHRVSREQLHRVTFTDPLTGLLNRAGFEDSAGRELARVSRVGGTLGFIILDIDRFKKINDTYGHPVGDSVLREIARILRAETRNLDHVIRFGGEEFGIILPHTNYDDIVMVAERIRAHVEATHFEFMPHAGAVTISLGALTIFPSSRLTLDQVYPVCDELLYQAKEGGRNRVVPGKFE